MATLKAFVMLMIFFLEVEVVVSTTAASACPSVPHHQCICNTTNGVQLKPSDFNAEHVDWRAVVLAAATGVLASSLAMEALGLILLWKSGGAVHTTPSTLIPKQPGFPDVNPSPLSRTSSSNGSWAEPRNREWPERSVSDVSSIKLRPGGRTWPRNLNESSF